MGCLDSFNRKCCVISIILSGIFTIVLQVILITLTELSFKDEKLKKELFTEGPIYNLNISTEKSKDKEETEIIFYEFQGRKKNPDNETDITDAKNITKIYQNYFQYKRDKRVYFDYKNDFSADPGQSCEENYKQCGILNTEGRILCLPTDEQCPINDFAISNIDNDPNYEGYIKHKVFDSIENMDYYIYYTNSKINNNIITEFKLSYGPICALSSETSWISVFEDEKEKNPTCNNKIDGNLYDYNYKEVPGGNISLKSIYYDNEISYTESNITLFNIEGKYVNLYSRNFIEKKEYCITTFFETTNKEDKNLKHFEKIIKIMGLICIILVFLLIVYTTILCCYEQSKCFAICLIVPIYGIISNSLSLLFVYKSTIEYDCAEKKINDKINNILKSKYSSDRSVVLATCILSMLLIFINFMCCIFLICNRDKTLQKPLPANNIFPQPIIFPQIPPPPIPISFINGQLSSSNKIAIYPNKIPHNMGANSSSSVSPFDRLNKKFGI